MGSHRIITSEGSAEITEKKSRFIADVKIVQNEEEASDRIDEIRKRYWDAKHHCYAYCIGDTAQITRFCDDGEPGGTAGRPILEAILNEKLCNVLVVVTRYFGGVLLGTGGLARAYSAAAREGLFASGTGIAKDATVYKIRTDYNDVGKVLRVFTKFEPEQRSSEYGEDVLLLAAVEEEKEQAFLKELTEVTNGRIKLEKEGKTVLVTQDGMRREQ